MLPLDDLLVEHTQLAPGQRCLLISQGQALRARALAAAFPTAAIDTIEIDFASRQRLTQIDARQPLSNLRTVDNEHTSFPDVPPPETIYDVIILAIPKGRLLAQRWLVHCAPVLPPGGRLLLAGPKDLGIQSIARDAEMLFGEKGIVLGYKKGQRVIAFTRPQTLPALPDWAEQPGISPESWAKADLETPIGRFTLKTLPGVFSFSGLDDGTRLLLENLRILEGDEALDLGCGTGIIGFYAAQNGASRVALADTNLLAVAAARQNVADLGLKNTVVYASDALSEIQNRSFSLIASNPPFHAGKGVDYQAAQAFIHDGRAALRPGGRMVIVANRFIRYELLMKDLFSSVETLAANNRFHVVCGWV